jgi:phosphoadenosine phosphosulfate reductase
MLSTSRRRGATVPPGLIAATLALLRRIERDYSPAALASSFSLEDMVLIDMIHRAGTDIGIFMIDTGRLHEETQALVAEVRNRYGVTVDTYFPLADSVERFVTENGPSAFFDSIALRRQCCAIRKVEPLRRALKGKRAWLTGQRRQHSAGRNDLPVEEEDTANGLHKVNPLAEWTTDDLWNYVASRDVPYNALYDRGYASIGCAPCTRAITIGEDMRAGRWWWEDDEGKECGLHGHAAGDGFRSRKRSSQPADPDES